MHKASIPGYPLTHHSASVFVYKESATYFWPKRSDRNGWGWARTSVTSWPYWAEVGTGLLNVCEGRNAKWIRLRTTARDLAPLCAMTLYLHKSRTKCSANPTHSSSSLFWLSSGFLMMARQKLPRCMSHYCAAGSMGMYSRAESKIQDTRKHQHNWTWFTSICFFFGRPEGVCCKIIQQLMIPQIREYTPESDVDSFGMAVEEHELFVFGWLFHSGVTYGWICIKIWCKMHITFAYGPMDNNKLGVESGHGRSAMSWFYSVE